MPTARPTGKPGREPAARHARLDLDAAGLVAGGLLELTGSLDRRGRTAIDSLQARSIDVDHRIAIEAYKLPGRCHKDPADRLLVATARIDALALVTADQRILASESVRTVDARRQAADRAPRHAHARWWQSCSARQVQGRLICVLRCSGLPTPRPAYRARLTREPYQNSIEHVTRREARKRSPLAIPIRLHRG